MHTDYERERAWWDAKALQEEQDLADEAVNRALRWREVERHLQGMHTILDVGGGTGVFSLPLARRGFQVTHLDLSPAMLEIARGKAQGLATIQFVEGNAADLGRFADRSFDLVLNMDGAISFCGTDAERAIQESCRVCDQTLIATVTHRAAMVPVWAASSLQITGRLTRAVWAMAERGDWHQDQFPENRALTTDLTLGYLGTLRAFLPQELRPLLEGAGMRVLRCGGLGSLASLCTPRAVQQTQKDEALWRSYLDLCEYYDLEVLPSGPGTRQRAGLIALAIRPSF